MSGETERGTDDLGTRGLARVLIDRAACQLAAAMDERGNWVVRVRRRKDEPWRLACSGNVDCLSVNTDLPRDSEESIVAGPVEIRPAGRRVLACGQEVALSRKEFDALLVLARDPMQVFTKDYLMNAVWGSEREQASRTLDSHMSRLRRKLAAAGAEGLVVNCWGVGYSLLSGDTERLR